MKILLVAINAKYIHSNLAVYCLKSYAAKRGIEVELTEYTINHRRDDILMDIYQRKPDLVGSAGNKMDFKFRISIRNCHRAVFRFNWQIICFFLRADMGNNFHLIVLFIFGQVAFQMRFFAQLSFYNTTVIFPDSTFF